jgi:hypothetical protein
MDEISRAINNPAVKAGLMLVAPEIVFGVQAVVGLFSVWTKHKPDAHDILSIIDRQVASMIEELSTSKSKLRREELEIRIHTLLGVLTKVK